MKKLTAAICLVLLANTAFAEEPQVEILEAAEGVYMLVGNGGNVGVFVGHEGTFLVDDQYAPMTTKILDAVESVGGDIPRFLINTHYHGDHTGGNQNLGDLGALIVAHDNTHRRLAEGTRIAAAGVESPPVTGSALPVVTFSTDVSFHLNGQVVKAIHVPGAHTDGDSIVHFTGSNVIHAGDLFFNGFYPFIDVEHGGTLKGVINGVEYVLTLSDEETVIIPGHGPLAGKPELEAYLDMLTTAYQRLSALKDQGKSVLEAVAEKPLADLQETWGQTYFDSDRWIQVIYAGLD